MSTVVRVLPDQNNTDLRWRCGVKRCKELSTGRVNRLTRRLFSFEENLQIGHVRALKLRLQQREPLPTQSNTFKPVTVMTHGSIALPRRRIRTSPPPETNNTPNHTNENDTMVTTSIVSPSTVWATSNCREGPRYEV